MKIYLGLTALFAGEKELENWTPCDGRTLNGNMILSAALQMLTGKSMGMNPTLPNLPDIGEVKHYMCTRNAPLSPGEDIEDIIGFVKELEGDAVPNNWLLCDGRHLDKAGADNVLLFNVICNKYGGYVYTPDFVLPNLNTGGKRYIICFNGTFPYS
jgi:microcystin-dependent protein